MSATVLRRVVGRMGYPFKKFKKAQTSERTA